MAGETIQHRELKRLAVAWLRRLGCSAVAVEVRCPLSRWRVDVAGWFDGTGDAPEGRGPLFERNADERGTARGRTILIECKQSRACLLYTSPSPRD